MFRVSVEETFSSGHALRGYKGKCENVHGHNYRVQVSIEGPQLDGIEFLNDLEPFKTVNPSAENMAKYFYEQMTARLREMPQGARLVEAVVWETDTANAVYRP
jgi:6-pyruvoyltetrahydropterin/6-carboxytetrahydropterin synthase